MAMFMMSNVSALVCASALALIYYVFSANRKPSAHVPGPWYTKYFAVVAKYHWLSGRKALWVHDLHQQYGPVVRVAPGEVAFVDGRMYKNVYNARETFRKSSWYRKLTGGNQSIFNTAQPELHRRLRKVLSNPMSDTSLQSMFPQVKARVELAIQRIGEEMNSRGAADVAKWWLFMATDIIGELSFGESFKTLEYGEFNGYTKDLQQLITLGAIRQTLPFLLPLAKILPIKLLKDAFESVHKINHYAEESLERHQRLVETDKLVSGTLFTNVFRAEEDETISFAEVVSNARAYIVAGSDTTSNTLTFLVWAVCRRPDIRETLIEELGKLPPGFGDRELRDLPFLGQVINEALRLYASAPAALPRLVPSGGVEILGNRIEAGATVSSQAYSMHRNPDAFEDPDSFMPSRWADPTDAMKDSFVPFGGGARVCIGLHLARMELRYATALFFRSWPNARVSTLEGMSDEDMKQKIYFLMGPVGQRCLIESS